MRRSWLLDSGAALIFQSTHPVWDATRSAIVTTAPLIISIHASRMGCDVAAEPSLGNVLISIHASRMGCDASRSQPRRLRQHFNPRIPYGMRLSSCLFRPRRKYFNPRIPYGMRRSSYPRSIMLSIFQSTHPVWDATRCLRVRCGFV